MSSPDTTPTQATPSPYRSMFGLAVVLLLGLLATAAVKSYRELATVHGREAELEERIEQTKRNIRDLEHRIALLGEDPLTLERLAREELGMVRPGDVVIVLPEEDAPDDEASRDSRMRGGSTEAGRGQSG